MSQQAAVNEYRRHRIGPLYVWGVNGSRHGGGCAVANNEQMTAVISISATPETGIAEADIQTTVIAPPNTIESYFSFTLS